MGWFADNVLTMWPFSNMLHLFLILVGLVLVSLVFLSQRMKFYAKCVSAFLGIMMACFIGIPIYLFWVHILRRDRDDFQIMYVSHLGRFYAWLFGMTYEIENPHFWKDSVPCVFVANHQSTFDMLAFTYFVPPRTMVVIKDSVKYIFPLGTFLFLMGNIFINRKDRSSSVKGLDKASEAIKQRNINVLVFPEGTRSYSSELLPFKKGAFHLAVKSQRPIVPFVVSDLGKLVDLDNKIIKSGLIRVRYLKPISTSGIESKDIDQLMESTRNLMIEELKSINAQEENHS